MMALSSGSWGKVKSSAPCPPQFSLQQVKLRLHIGGIMFIFMFII